nr:UDP-glucuronosyltransferase 2B2-like [Leptinotarsa decemlineata]
MLNFQGDLSFIDKLKSFLFNIWYRAIYYWYALPMADRVARKYFGEDMPYLGDIERNISLLLLNVNPIMQTVRANVPNVIEVNQMHIREKKPLPKDLQEYLDSSSEGVVYFSLGSNVKSANLTSRMRDVIMGAFSEVPYNILWKFETDDLSGRPDNVLTRKWLPQQDVLGHPNIKAFITQGGAQSIEEAIYNEVPMIGIPFITDQPTNVRRVVDLGMGLGLDYRTMTKGQLKNAIQEVIENKKYKKRVQESKAILVDQPIKGVEKAVWWIEYVIRHKGARILRSPSADMPFAEYFMLDVIGFILLCICLSFYAVEKVFALLRYILYSRRTKLKEN